MDVRKTRRPQNRNSEGSPCKTHIGKRKQPFSQAFSRKEASSHKSVIQLIAHNLCFLLSRLTTSGIASSVLHACHKQTTSPKHAPLAAVVPCQPVQGPLLNGGPVCSSALNKQGLACISSDVTLQQSLYLFGGVRPLKCAHRSGHPVQHSA